MGDTVNKIGKHRRDSPTSSALDIGKRISEAFGYRQIPEIALQLDCDHFEIAAVMHGEILPSASMLIAINSTTGASIDWLLTGNGTKYGKKGQIADTTPEPVSPAMWFAGEERERTGQLL